MRKIVAALFMVAGVTLMAAPALAAKNNPHQEEIDGCDHGHTGKACKPDPQPTHGKDCVKHGKHGGINEDHCATTTTTQPPITTTTLPVTTTTQPVTTTTVGNTTITQPVVTSTTQSPTVTISGTTVAAPKTSETPTPTLAVTPGSLAKTGTASDILIGAGFGLILFGIGTWMLSKISATPLWSKKTKV
jgi:hypothetical protein